MAQRAGLADRGRALGDQAVVEPLLQVAGKLAHLAGLDTLGADRRHALGGPEPRALDADELEILLTAQPVVEGEPEGLVVVLAWVVIEDIRDDLGVEQRL